jgi:hypothetical protein
MNFALNNKFLLKGVSILTPAKSILGQKYLIQSLSRNFSSHLINPVDMGKRREAEAQLSSSDKSAHKKAKKY